MSNNSNTVTPLPANYFCHKNMLSWTIQNGYMHVHIEEPYIWGINGLDLDMVIRLDENGLPNDDWENIMESQATSANHEDTKFEVDHDTALDMITVLLIPSIRKAFPNIAI